eukprot:CAMPEP_0116932470 /NCGR_PEP_ID=MMETSP0467-20121206/28452_1 /TAXON_ID=283647 /ORGANISM="Mesodinium pulex, Strain SPMC105" /LENGTH=87 /DNA_ID=CAMNT_0004613149 /DNA_START=102 /DNA_END=365 /DNA_ORIENTATION=-
MNINQLNTMDHIILLNEPIVLQVLVHIDVCCATHKYKGRSTFLPNDDDEEEEALMELLENEHRSFRLNHSLMELQVTDGINLFKIVE